MITKNLFLLIVFFLPFQFALNVGSNIDLVTTRVLVLLVFLLWLFQGLAKKEIWLPKKVEIFAVVFFIILSLLSLFLGQDPQKGFRKILYFLSVLPVFFVGASLLKEESLRKRTIVAVIASGTLAATVALGQFWLQFLIGLDPVLDIWRSISPHILGNSFGKLVANNPSWLVEISGEARMRAVGFFPDPHATSVFISLAFFVSAGYAFQERSKRISFWAIFAAILMLAAVLLSFSRGAYLGLGAGSLFFFFFLLKRIGKLKKILVGLIVFTLIILAVDSGAIAKRFESVFNLREGSNMERIKNWEEAAEIIRDKPLSGVGLGNYSSTVDPAADARSSIYAHNLFLDIAAETGILNAVVFLVLILSSVWRGIRSRGMIGLGIASGLVYFLVHGLFETSIWAPQVLVMFLVILTIGLHANIPKKEAPNEK